MKNTIMDSMQSTVKNWWMSLIIGILFLFMGIWMLFAPGATFEALVIVFSVFMFVSGIFEIAFAASNSKRLRGWGWYLVVGILDVLIGGYLMAHPGLTALLIPFIIAFWLMFRGFSIVGMSIDAQSFGVKGWGWYLVLGILAVIASLLVIWEPTVGIIMSVYMAACAFLIIGIFRTAFAFKLKKLGKGMKE